MNRIVKPFGKGGAHITLPVDYKGKWVKIELIEKLDYTKEIAYIGQKVVLPEQLAN